MCGRFTQTMDAASIAARFGLAKPNPLAVAAYNIAPTHPVAVVLHEGGASALELVRWGLVAPWARTLKDQPQPINAKAETLATSPLFRRLLPSRRCLVVADGFYEWKGTKGHKQPVRVTLKSRELFAFAGLWDRWRDPSHPEAPPLRTCTIVTVAANSLVAPIHDRMPAILTRENERHWLDVKLTDSKELKALLTPYDPQELSLYEAEPYVNDVRRQGPECLEPVRRLV